MDSSLCLCVLRTSNIQLHIWYIGRSSMQHKTFFSGQLTIYLGNNSKSVALLTLFESEMERCFIVVFASHVFGFSRNIHSIGFVWCYFLMLNHILFGWGVCLSIYCLHEWLFWSFIVCLIHLSQWFLALLVEITTKIIESLKCCLCHNILLSSFIYSAWFIYSLQVC